MVSSLQRRQSLQVCFLFVFEIYGNTPWEKSSHQKAEESTVACSTAGKPCQIPHHADLPHTSVPPAPGEPAHTLGVQILKANISHALPTTRSSGKSQLNCSPWDAEASPEGREPPLLAPPPQPYIPLHPSSPGLKPKGTFTLLNKALRSKVELLKKMLQN